MAHVLGFIVFVGIALCVLEVKSLTIDDVYNLLARRLDDIMFESRSNLNIINDKLKTLEQRIKSFEERATEFRKEIDNMTNTLSDKLIDKRADLSVEDPYRRQRIAILKTLTFEKYNLRKSETRIENNFNELAAYIKGELLNISVDLKDEVSKMHTSNEEYRASFDRDIQKLNSSWEVSFGNFQNTERETDNRLSSLESSVTSVQRRISSQESKQQTLSTKLSNHDNQLSSVHSRITRGDSERSSHNRQISSLSSRLSEEERRTVGFTVRLQKPNRYYAKSETLKFDTVVYNYGDGFDRNTGKFTAPRSGTYLFAFNIEGQEHGKAHIALNVNGYWITRVVVTAATDNSASNVAIEYVSAGQKVCLDTALFEDEYYTGPYRGTFNGVLID